MPFRRGRGCGSDMPEVCWRLSLVAHILEEEKYGCIMGALVVTFTTEDTAISAHGLERAEGTELYPRGGQTDIAQIQWL